jgi:hypothetical protein
VQALVVILLLLPQDIRIGILPSTQTQQDQKQYH